MRDVRIQADSIEDCLGHFIPAIQVIIVGPEDTRTDCGTVWIGDGEYTTRHAAENDAAKHAKKVFEILLNRTEIDIGR